MGTLPWLRGNGFLDSCRTLWGQAAICVFIVDGLDCGLCALSTCASPRMESGLKWAEVPRGGKSTWPSSLFVQALDMLRSGTGLALVLQDPCWVPHFMEAFSEHTTPYFLKSHYILFFHLVSLV